MDTVKTNIRILDLRGNPIIEETRSASIDGLLDGAGVCPSGLLSSGSESDLSRRSGREEKQIQPFAACPRNGECRGPCERRPCSLKGALVDWFELISLAMLLMTGLFEHVRWLIRWALEVLRATK